MCLAVPMKLIELTDATSGRVEFEGVQTRVNLSLVENPKVGEYFLVHAGFAIERLDEQVANEHIALLKELAEEISPENLQK